MFRKSILFILILLIPFLAFAQELSERDAFIAAKEAYDRGSYGVSLNLFERFVGSFSQSKALPEAKLYMGQCLFQESRFSQARDILIKLERDFVSYGIEDRLLFWLGQVYLKVKDFEQADGYFRKLIKLHPDSNLLYSTKMQLGWIYLQEGRLEEAEVLFDTLAESEDVAIQEEALYNKGELQFQAKDYNSALETFKTFEKQFPDSDQLANVYFYMAESNYYLEDLDKAIKYYTQAAEKSSDDLVKAESLQGIGWSYLNKNDLAEVEKAFSKVDEVTSEDFNRESLFLGKATLYYRSHRLEEAYAYYEKLLNIYPESDMVVQALFGEAECLNGLSRFDEAIGVYREAIERGSDKDSDEAKSLLTQAHYNLGLVYFQIEDFKSAIPEFKKAALSNNEEIRLSALYHLADSYQNAQELDRAIEAYDTIMHDYPDSSYSDYVLFQLGLVQLKYGQINFAISSFKKFNRQFTESEFLDDINYYLGYAYFRNDDFEMATHLLDKFLTIFPDSIYIHKAAYLLAISFYSQGMFNDAIYYFEKIIRESQQDKDLVMKAEYELANILYQIGEEQSAIKKYSQFIKSHPNSEITPTLVFWLGQYYHKNSQLERARRNFETLVRMYPKHKLAPEAKYQIGLTFLSEGKYNNAQQMFERLLGITDQKSIRAKTMLAIGDLLSQDGQQEKAIKVYNELTQLISPEDAESLTKSMPKQKIESEILADSEIKITTESKQDEVDSDSGFQFVKLAYVRLGDIYQERKEFQKAVSFYGEALKYPLDENSASIQFKIAESYEEANDLDSALEAYSNISGNFEQDTIWIVKGLLRSSRVYEDKREWKAALKAYQRIIDYDVPEAKYAQERLTLIKKQIELY